MEQLISSQEKENKINNKEEEKESEKNDKLTKDIFEPKKDIIFYEDNSKDVEEGINENKSIEEKDEDSLPSFIYLHKACIIFS